jgi:hypothetical protein
MVAARCPIVHNNRQSIRPSPRPVVAPELHENQVKEIPNYGSSC